MEHIVSIPRGIGEGVLTKILGTEQPRSINDLNDHNALNAINGAYK
jgi:hypothetical protein